ncbi:hypothetical protein P7G58_09070 [Globicatella sulfidifaciens]|uniref:hypothetical protein n=1 Tax=Globicatella sulfidifaciens TaxID=136093 RepID=UPI00288DAB0F|nr:hypothetical protein [Globicatella sulfidifaciens]MDT2769003.1 hypothetical protein [Globicatella sulfidifaciens]
MNNQFTELNLEELLDIEIEAYEMEINIDEINVQFSHTEPRPSTTSVCQTRP